MRAPLSIVIATLNAEAALAPCLVALMAGVEAGLVRELIVADAGSTDDTRVLAQAVGAAWVDSAPGWAAQVAAGVAASGGDWVLALPARSVPGPGWVEAAQAGMARGTPGHFRLRLLGAGRLARARAALARPGPAHGLLAPRAGWPGARPRPLAGWVSAAPD